MVQVKTRFIDDKYLKVSYPKKQKTRVIEKIKEQILMELDAPDLNSKDLATQDSLNSN